MTRRTFSAWLAVVLAGFLLVPAPAYGSAGVPLPGPVDEIADLPARLVRSATGSPVGDSVVRDMLEAQKALIALKRAQDAGTLATAAPKPLTAPALITRGAVPGSILAGAFYGGFALGQGGLTVYAMANNTTSESMMCATPDWYQVGIDVISLGLVGCNAPVGTINQDAGTTPIIRYGAFSTYLTGFLPASNINCWRWSAVPSGHTLRVLRADGQYWTVNTGVNHAGCSQPAFYTQPYWAGSGALRLINNATGQIVAEAAVPDPIRTPDCRIEWEDGSVTTGQGAAYKEADGIPMSAAGLGCEQAYVSKPGRGPDLLPSRISVGSTRDDDGVRTILTDQEVPEFGPDERKAFETGNGRGLVLEKVAGTVMTSCMTWAADCSGWWEATDEGTTTGMYRCTYGGAEVALVECGAYRYTFDTQTATPTITDPVTGTQTPWTTQPSTSNSINPGTGPGTGSNPAGECFASGWSAFNPIEWVLTPVKCAFVWAFVPRTTVVDAGFASMESRWQNTAIGGLATAVAGWSFVAPSSSGCDGITVGISELGHDIEDFQILNACAGEPLEPIASLSTLVIGIGAVLTAIAAVTGSVGGIVGQRPLAAGAGS